MTIAIERLSIGQPFFSKIDGVWRVETADARNFSDTRKSGYAAGVGTSWVSLWPDTSRYTPRATATTLYISSEDATDTSAGDGARTVEITGLDADLNELTPVIVSLNGQAQVQIVPDMRFITGAHVATAGADGQNAGNIWIGESGATAGVPATKHAVIPFDAAGLGYGQIQQDFAYVPAGYRGIITRVWLAAGGSKIVYFRLMVRQPGQAYRAILPVNSFSVNYDQPQYLDIPSGTFIEMVVRTDTGTVDVSGGFNLVLLKDR